MKQCSPESASRILLFLCAIAMALIAVKSLGEDISKRTGDRNASTREAVSGLTLRCPDSSVAITNPAAFLRDIEIVNAPSALQENEKEALRSVIASAQVGAQRLRKAVQIDCKWPIIDCLFRYCHEFAELRIRCDGDSPVMLEDLWRCVIEYSYKEGKSSTLSPSDIEGGAMTSATNDVQKAASGVPMVVQFRQVAESGFPGSTEIRSAGGAISVHSEILLSNGDVAGAFWGHLREKEDACYVTIKLSKSGQKKITDLTASHVGMSIAILIDGESVAVFKVAEASHGFPIQISPLSAAVAQRISSSIRQMARGNGSSRED